MKSPEELLDGYLDDLLSPEEAVQFSEWLSEHPENVRTLARAAFDHAALASHFRHATAQENIRVTPSTSGNVIQIPMLKWGVVAVAAGIVLACGAFWPSAWSRPVRPVLSSGSGQLILERDGNQSQATPGAGLLPGDVLRTAPASRAIVRYGKENTYIELEENSAVKVMTEARGKRLKMIQGGAELKVSEQPHGYPMVVLTSQAAVELGQTRTYIFSGPKSTRVNVSEGRVFLKASANNDTTELPAGTQGIVFADGNVTAGQPFSPHPATPATEAPESTTGSLTSPPQGRGALLRETWFNVPGSNVNDLLTNPAFSGPPSVRDFPTSLDTIEGGAEHDLYGSRWRGYLHPPVSGAYTLWVAADDSAELRLGSDESPESARLLASVPGYTLKREWTKFPEQESKSVQLVAGQRYYIEILHKELAGGDHLSVAWEIPGEGIEVIRGPFLSPFIP